MTTMNGIKLEYNTSKRNSYMSLGDLIQDLTTECLINLLPTIKEFKKQMLLMGEVEKRNELSDDRYFELLETCNGI
jgi:hypothetical protein